MKHLNKKVSVLVLLLFLGIIFNGLQGEVITSQEEESKTYYNNSKISYYLYYKEVSVDDHGKIKLDGKYDDTLGEFQYAIHSQYVYKVAFDKNKELVKYFRRGRIYTPHYISFSDRRVKEMIITSESSMDFKKIRQYNYTNSGRVSEMLEYDKKLDNKKMEVKLVLNQSVSYKYENGNLIGESYKSFEKERNVSARSVKMSYKGNSLSKKEFFDEKGQLQYYYTYGTVTEQHKPDGSVVRKILHNKKGDFTTEYYPPISVKKDSKWEVIVTEKYNKGAEVGFYKERGAIYRLTKLYPRKNGFSTNDYTVGQNDKGERIVIEKTSFTQHGSWKKSSTIVQKAYTVIKRGEFSSAKKLYTKWLSEEGKDLLSSLPPELVNVITPSVRDFTGAEYIVVAKLNSSGSITLAEIFTKDGKRSWCDISNGYLFFIASLMEGNDLDYNKIVIKSKGYSDVKKTFKVSKNKRIINLGDINMVRE